MSPKAIEGIQKIYIWYIDSHPTQEQQSPPLTPLDSLDNEKLKFRPTEVVLPKTLPNSLKHLTNLERIVISKAGSIEEIKF